MNNTGLHHVSVLSSNAQGLILTRVTSAQVNVDLEGKFLAMP